MRSNQSTSSTKSSRPSVTTPSRRSWALTNSLTKLGRTPIRTPPSSAIRSSEPQEPRWLILKREEEDMAGVVKKSIAGPSDIIPRHKAETTSMGGVPVFTPSRYMPRRCVLTTKLPSLDKKPPKIVVGRSVPHRVIQKMAVERKYPFLCSTDSHVLMNVGKPSQNIKSFSSNASISSHNLNNNDAKEENKNLTYTKSFCQVSKPKNYRMRPSEVSFESYRQIRCCVNKYYLKLLFILLNGLAIACGLILLGTTIFVVANMRLVCTFFTWNTFLMTTLVLGLNSSLVLLSSLLGICGVWNRNHCCVLMNAGLAAILAVTFMANAFVQSAYQTTMENEVEMRMTQSLSKAANDRGVREIFSLIHTSLRCCGAFGFTDWCDNMPMYNGSSELNVDYQNSDRKEGTLANIQLVTYKDDSFSNRWKVEDTTKDSENGPNRNQSFIKKANKIHPDSKEEFYTKPNMIYTTVDSLRISKAPKYRHKPTHQRNVVKTNKNVTNKTNDGNFSVSPEFKTGNCKVPKSCCFTDKKQLQSPNGDVDRSLVIDEREGGNETTVITDCTVMPTSYNTHRVGCVKPMVTLLSITGTVFRSMCVILSLLLLSIATMSLFIFVCC